MLIPAAWLFTAITIALVTVGYAARTHIALQRIRAETKAARVIIDGLEHDHWTFLAIASKALTSSLDYSKTLNKVLLLPVPDLADVCTVYSCEEDGSITMVRHGIQRFDAQHEYGTFHRIELDADDPVSDVLNNTECRTSIGLGTTTLIIPLRSRNVIIGAVKLQCHRPGFIYTVSHKKLAEQLAASAALAIDNARLYEKAQQEIQNRERTVALVSHDLKNPLCAIDVATQLLQRSADQDPASELAKYSRHIQLIRNASTQMDGLIRNLLDAAKLKAGSFQIDKAPRALNTLLQEYIEFSKALAQPKDIEVTLLAPAHEQEIMVDTETMFRAFSNIVGNAIKFTPHGGKIMIKVIQDTRGEVQITVADSGPGIAPDDQPHVFDDFWQAQPTAKLGTGLGLSIAKGIVEAHGGRIWAEKSPYGGAAFSFTTGPRLDA